MITGGTPAQQETIREALTWYPPLKREISFTLGDRNYAGYTGLTVDARLHGADLQLVLSHEYGHVWDRHWLTWADQQRVLDTIGRSAWRDDSQGYMAEPAEQWAGAFARHVGAGHIDVNSQLAYGDNIPLSLVGELIDQYAAPTPAPEPAPEEPTMRFRVSGRNWEGREWTLAPCLVTLAHQIDEAFPVRHAADGTVASKRHDEVNPTSDHRPKPFVGKGIVRAVDFGETTENDAFEICEAIRVSRDPRVTYVIHERQLFSSYPAHGFAPYMWRPYNLSPHLDHGHVSTLATADNDSSPWQIGDDMTPDEKRAVAFWTKTFLEMEKDLVPMTSADWASTLVLAHRAGTSGVSEAKVKEFIAAHASNPDAHHA